MNSREKFRGRAVGGTSMLKFSNVSRNQELACFCSFRSTVQLSTDAEFRIWSAMSITSWNTKREVSGRYLVLSIGTLPKELAQWRTTLKCMMKFSSVALPSGSFGWRNLGQQNHVSSRLITPGHSQAAHWGVSTGKKKSHSLGCSGEHLPPPEMANVSALLTPQAEAQTPRRYFQLLSRVLFVLLTSEVLNSHHGPSGFNSCVFMTFFK